MLSRPSGAPIEIVVHTDLPAVIEMVDQGLARKGEHNVRLAHHGRTD
jgi:hypothetical protein